MQCRVCCGIPEGAKFLRYFHCLLICMLSMLATYMIRYCKKKITYTLIFCIYDRPICVYWRMKITYCGWWEGWCFPFVQCFCFCLVIHHQTSTVKSCTILHDSFPLHSQPSFTWFKHPNSATGATNVLLWVNTQIKELLLAIHGLLRYINALTMRLIGWSFGF